MSAAVDRMKERYGRRVVAPSAAPSAAIIKHPAAPAADDADKVQVPDELAAEVAATVASNDASQREAQVLRFNADHFVAVEGGVTSVYREAFDHELGRARLDRMSPQSFRVLHAHEYATVSDGDGNQKRVPVAAAWLSHPQRRTYPGGVALLPGRDTPPGVYNLWQGFGCVPKAGATRDDVKPALVHLLRVVCAGGQEEFDYLLKWLASAVQNPGQQAEVAVVLQGGRGSGKGTVGRWFRDLFGPHGMHVQHPRHLVGNFNAHLRSCLAMFVDEAFFVGDRAGNAVLKSLISEDQLVIEKKGVDVVSVRNRLKIVMATNEDHAILAGEDERRYFVLRVSSVKAQDHDYFGRLDRWWHDGGKEALLGYLLALDLAGFNIRRVPNTAALERQKIESLGVFNRWLFDKLSDGRWEQDRGAEFWATEFAAYAERHREGRFAKTSATAVGMQMRDAGIPVAKVRQTSGDRRNVWQVPPLDQARAMFAEKFGLTRHRWDGDGLEPETDEEEGV